MVSLIKLETINDLTQAAGTVVYAFYAFYENYNEQFDSSDSVLDDDDNELDSLSEEEEEFDDEEEEETRQAFLTSLETRTFEINDKGMYRFLMFLIESSDLMGSQDVFLCFGKTFYEVFEFYELELDNEDSYYFLFFIFDKKKFLYF